MAVELRLIDGAAEALGATVGPVEFEADCIERWQDSLTARAFSQRTIDGSVPVLERFLSRCGCPVWQVSRERHRPGDGRAVRWGPGGLDQIRIPADLQGFLCLRRSVVHGVEVEQRFGVVMVNPVDAFNSPAHVGSGLEASRPPPTPQRLEDFFRALARPDRHGSQIRHRSARLHLVSHLATSATSLRSRCRARSTSSFRSGTHRSGSSRRCATWSHIVRRTTGT